MKIIYFLFVLCFISLISCSDDCVICKLNENSQEYCDDGETQYSDVNGNTIQFDEFILSQETAGYTCD